VRSGSHKDNLKAVLNSEVDVATYNSEGLDLLKTEAPADFNKLRVIWTSPMIPNDPLLYRKDLSPALKNKLEEFLRIMANGPMRARKKPCVRFRICPVLRARTMRS
jgi:ABC-type phosphate/phosphonate transport system substrate-binding protein